nr:hypothetical protein [Candidatus Sigynarchaeum springense]
MLIEEIFKLTKRLSCAVQQKSRIDRILVITRQYIEEITDGDTLIKNHVARETIIDRVFFDV